MKCYNCKKEFEEILDTCPFCGAKVAKRKNRKPVYKKWWFWVLMGIATLFSLIIVTPSDTESTTSSNSSQVTSNNNNSNSHTIESITYEKIDLKTMINELDNNALKAERTYQDKYVEVIGEITNFDSDGSYISIEPVNADDWSFDTVLCKIKDDEQLDFLLEKEVGEKVTIRGQIVSIGEFLGYTIKIHEIY